LEQQRQKENLKYEWQETDTTFALLKGKEIIWQYNFNTIYGRPFFHPVTVNKNIITCLSPDDHPWHLGQWFSWKYINNINYWEYNKGSFQSEGVTEINSIEFKKNPDYSAEIRLKLTYHPFGREENVLSEERKILISPPQQDGKIWMDYDFLFKALSDKVELNRTPILGQENGKSWGGYSGLSLRFNQYFGKPEFITPWNYKDSINGSEGDWLYLGFTGNDGVKIGSQIMVPMESKRNGWAWYSSVLEQKSIYYFSPAYLYSKPIILKKGDEILLKYRILHLPGNVNKNMLNFEFKRYINQ
jgi:hypothetical protein